MDDADPIVARFQRRMANAEWHFRRAEVQRTAADNLEREINLPDHLRPVGDESIKLLEIKLRRQEADEQTRQAEGIIERLYETPSLKLTKQVEKWAAQFDRHARQRDDRER